MTFEGLKRPNCPFCGASRPRPRLRLVGAPDPEETAEHLAEEAGLHVVEPIEVEYVFDGKKATITLVAHLEDL